MANLSNINNVLRVSTNLRVGINTDEASYALEIGGTNSGIKLKNSGASGKVYSLLSDTSGNFQIYDDAATSGRLVISSGGDATFAGNVGIGITPSASFSGVEVLQLGKGMTIFGNTNDDRATMASNLILNTGTAFEYVMDGLAGKFSIEDGNMSFGTAPSGTAGNVATITERFAIANTGAATFAGDVSININTKIGEISGYNGVTLNGTLDINNYNLLSRSSDNHLFINRPSSADINFRENNADQVVIKSGGNVGIGINSPVAPLQVKTTTDVNFTVDQSGSNLRLSAVNDVSDTAIPMQFNGSTYGFISGGTTTFSGSVAISHSSGDSLILTKTTTEPSLRIEGDSGKDFVITVSGELLTFTQNDGGTDILTLDHDTKNATFASNVTLSSGFVNVPAGAVGTPSLIFAGDDDTGLWHPASNTLAFSTFGSERMRIDSSGRVGIGMTPSDYAGYPLQLTGGSQTLIAIGNDTTGTGALNGLIIGNDSTGADIYQREAQPLRFHTSNIERMRITSGGNILFRATSLAGIVGASPVGSGFGMESNNRATLFQGTTSTSAMTMQAFYNPNGQVGRIALSGSTTTYYTNSDYRLKEDLKDFNGLDKISKIPVYDFKWKVDESRSYGVLAHELQEVIPDAVGGEKDAVNEDESINPQGVDYSKIVPILVKSIQELKAEIEILKNK